MLSLNSLSLYAPSGLHKGFLTMVRVWVQAAINSVCTVFLVPEGSRVGLTKEFFFLMGFW